MLDIIRNKTNQIISSTEALGGVGLLVFEDENSIESSIQTIRELLFQNNYEECSDYLEVMDVLSEGKDKLFYVETQNKLDGSVLEIICEFEAGILSLYSRKNEIGLKISNWSPTKTSLIIIMTRKQVENSYPQLFEYIKFIQSI